MCFHPASYPSRLSLGHGDPLDDELPSSVSLSAQLSLTHSAPACSAPSRSAQSETRQKRVRRWFRPRPLGDQRARFSVASLLAVRFVTRGAGNGRAPRSPAPPHHHGQMPLSRQATANYATMRSRVVAQIVRTTWPHLSGQTERRETSRLLHPTHAYTFVSSGADETFLALLCRYVSSLARRLIPPQHQRSARRHPVIHAECLKCQGYVTRRGRQRLKNLRCPRSPSCSCLAFGKGVYVPVNTTAGPAQKMILGSSSHTAYAHFQGGCTIHTSLPVLALPAVKGRTSLSARWLTLPAPPVPRSRRAPLCFPHRHLLNDGH